MNRASFEQIRNRRRAALALARIPSQAGLNPYGGDTVHAIRFSATTAERGVLYVETGNGCNYKLPGFARCHAEQMSAMASSRWLGYLRDIWLNYLAWRCAN